MRRKSSIKTKVLLLYSPGELSYLTKGISKEGLLVSPLKNEFEIWLDVTVDRHDK